MATLASLIVKIGANDAEIQKSLEKLGASVKRTDADFKKLGNTPIAQQAQKSLEALNVTIKGVTDSQQRFAERAKFAAQGLTAIGGPARLMKTELDQVNRTVLQGIDAFRALGQQAPAELQKVAAAIQQQQKLLAQSSGPGNAQLGNALSGLPGGRTLSAFATGGAAAGLAAGATAGAGAFVLAAKAAIDYSDTLTKLSDQTRISAFDLQGLEAIALASGNTLEQVAKGSSQFQLRLASDNKQTAQALQDIGLSSAQLRALAPDQQLLAIARGFQAIVDPAEEARIAQDLFGKSGIELIPTLKANIDALKDSTFRMSNESVAALDDFGDSIGRLFKNASALSGEFFARLIWTPQQALFMRAVAEAKDAEAKLKGLQALLTPDALSPLAIGRTDGELPALKERIRLFDANQQAVTAHRQAIAALGAELSGQRALKGLRDLNEAWRAQPAAIRENPLAIARLVAAYEPLARQLSPDQLPSELRDTVDAFNELQESLRKVQAASVGLPAALKVDVASELPALNSYVAALARLAAVDRELAKRTAPPILIDLTKLGTPVPAPIFESANEHAEEFRKNLDELSQSFAQLAQISGDAFGGTVQDIANVIASLNLATKAADQYRNANGKILGQASAIVAGGAAIAQATGQGSSGSRVAGGAATGAAVGSVFGPIGTGVGAAVGAIVGWIRASREARRELEELHAALKFLINSSGGLPELTARAQIAGIAMTDLARAIASNNPDKLRRELEQLLAALDFQDQAMQTLDETVGRYNFTIEEKGPAIALREQTKIAEKLYQDFRLLTAAGVAHAAIGREMAASTNLYVQNALKMGQEIPEFMRAQILKMIELGLLYDTTGTKITSLEGSGITFSETMTASIDRIITAVQALVEAIDRGLGLVIRNVPDLVVDVVYNDPGYRTPRGPRAFGSMGGRVTEQGIQPFETGGRVLPFLSRGRDTVPAMLTPGEVVSTAQQWDAISAALAGGGGVTVNVDARGAYFNRSTADELAQLVLDKVNEGGSHRSKFNSAVRKAG